MTIITKRIAGDGDPVRGYVSFYIEYDDTLNPLRLSALICDNQSTELCWGKATSNQTGRSYEYTFPASQLTRLDIPGNAAQRLDITITPNGRVSGCDYFFMWPAP